MIRDFNKEIIGFKYNWRLVDIYRNIIKKKSVGSR